MKKLMLFLTLVILSKAYAYADNFNSFQLPNYPIEKGVSAPFAGFIGDWLIVGGGCNFPTKPAADGGSKVYYKECYAINTRSKAPEWTQITDLPLPVAYGCAVETTQGLVCIGGMNADSCLTSVFLIEPQKNKRGFSIRTLPSLPQTIDNASATAINNVIYITGGNQQNKGKSLFRFNGKHCPPIPDRNEPSRYLSTTVAICIWQEDFKLPRKKRKVSCRTTSYALIRNVINGSISRKYLTRKTVKNVAWLEEQAHKRPPISSLPEELITPFSKTLSKEKPIKITCAKIRCGINSTMMFCFLISNRKNGQFTPIHSEWPAQEAYCCITTTACI